VDIITKNTLWRFYIMNKVILIGRLVKDAEIKVIGQDGKSVLNFTLAVRRNYVNDQNETESDFIPVSYWHKSAQSLQKYLIKGRMVGVEGRINVRSYEAVGGGRKYITQIIADQIQFLDSKKSEQDAI
jgi:single-strand DNA-binding protein